MTKRCFQLSFIVKKLTSTSLQNKNIGNQQQGIQTESLDVVLQWYFELESDRCKPTRI